MNVPVIFFLFFFFWKVALAFSHTHFFQDPGTSFSIQFWSVQFWSAVRQIIASTLLIMDYMNRLTIKQLLLFNLWGYHKNLYWQRQWIHSVLASFILMFTTPLRKRRKYASQLQFSLYLGTSHPVVWASLANCRHCFCTHSLFFFFVCPHSS